MKIHYCGKLTGDELPSKEVVANATEVRYKDIGFLIEIPGFFIPYMIADILASSITGYPFYIRAGIFASTWFFVILHEILHGIWFKEDSYIFRIPKQGFLITSTEDLTKCNVIVMLLFPSLILGIFPIIVSFFCPFKFLFAFGIYSLIMGMLDFNYVLSIMKQVPQRAMVFFSGGKTFFYIPN